MARYKRRKSRDVGGSTGGANVDSNEAVEGSDQDPVGNLEGLEIGDVSNTRSDSGHSNMDTEEAGNETDTASKGPHSPQTLEWWTQTDKVKVKTKGTQARRQFYIDSATNTEADEESTKKCVLQLVLFNDRQFLVFTGVDKCVFQFLLYRIGSRLTDSRNITRENKVLLVLVQLKMNMESTALAALLDISRVAVKGIFASTLNALKDTVEHFVIWLNRETVQARLPEAFRPHPMTRVILDCSEVECSVPQDPAIRVKMYSNYKKWFTMKYLVGTAPCGEITFVSKMFGGCATDTEIVNKSRFLELVEPGDEVLADKSFPTIESGVLTGGGVLVMPPFKDSRKGFQFSAHENTKAYRVARLRVHVERMIQRMKIFETQDDYIRSDIHEFMNDILVVIAALCNLSKSLIKK